MPDQRRSHCRDAASLVASQRWCFCSSISHLAKEGVTAGSFRAALDAVPFGLRAAQYAAPFELCAALDAAPFELCAALDDVPDAVRVFPDAVPGQSAESAESASLSPGLQRPQMSSTA